MKHLQKPTPPEPEPTTHLIQKARWRLNCSCGGFCWVSEEGEFDSHSEPIDTSIPHDVAPWFRADIVWRYEVVK